MLYNLLSTHLLWLDSLLYWNLNIALRLQLRENEKDDFVVNKFPRLNEKALLLYMIIKWTILYTIYKKCINAHFRNLGYALIRRNRISSVLWSCGLNCIIILYVIFLWDSLLKPELSVIILKSFYIHFSGVIIFSHNNWLRGFSNLLFMLFIFGIPRSSLQPPVSSIFMLKSADILMLDICRMLYLKWPKKVKQIYAKTFYSVYCIFWIYFYMIYIPKNVLLPYKYQSHQEKFCLWLWFITHYLDFMTVWLNLIRNFKSTQLNFLELCMFPRPSDEYMQLSKILESHKEIKNKKDTKKVSMKQLHQTILCSMIIKRKIKERQQRKKEMENKILSEPENSELKQVETEIDKVTPICTKIIKEKIKERLQRKKEMEKKSSSAPANSELKTI